VGRYLERCLARTHYARNLTGACAAEDIVHRAPDAGRYVLADAAASGPAMFHTARLDLGRRPGSHRSCYMIACR